MNLPELVSLTAPRALFVQSCSQDRLFPLSGMQPPVKRIAELYRVAGSPDQFLGRFYDERHRWTIAMQDEAFSWLEEKLSHRR